MCHAESLEDWIKYAKEMREQIRACLPQKIERISNKNDSELRGKINQIIDHINQQPEVRENHDKCDKQEKKEVPFRVGGVYEKMVDDGSIIKNGFRFFIHRDDSDEYTGFGEEGDSRYCIGSSQENWETKIEKGEIKYIGQLSDIIEKSLKNN
jgi:hypothetical protein